MLRYRARMGRELCVTYNKIGNNFSCANCILRAARWGAKCSSERGDETRTREKAYGDPIPQNVNFLDEKQKVKSLYIAGSSEFCDDGRSKVKGM
jgi:hypothetical protein